MKINSIGSASNSLLKKVRSLQQRSGREQHGLFLLEGPKLLVEAQSKGIVIQDVIVSSSYLNSGFSASENPNIEQITVVDDKLFRDLTTTSTPCGIVSTGKIHTPKFSDCLKGTATLIAVAESVQDPGNLGTMLRTGDAVGAGGLILIDDCADPFGVEAVRASMGAIFTQKIAQATWDEFLPWLRDGSGQLVAASLRDAVPHRDAPYTAPCFILVGNESRGLPEEYEAACDLRVTMPMRGRADSLNAAVAAAVLAYEVLATLEG